METLEFVIHPNGRVEEKVTGIQGSSCTEVTKKIEEQLGCVITHEKTSDFYAQAVTETSSSVSTNATQSYW
jgi:hypothetical protein